jgi:hypothetical protein
MGPSALSCAVASSAPTSSPAEPSAPGAPPSTVAESDGAPGATYDDVFALLTEINERLIRVETFCNQVQQAVDTMPAFPFMPKFKLGASNGGR